MIRYRIRQDLTDWEKYRVTLWVLFHAKMIRRVLFVTSLPFIIGTFISILLVFLGGSYEAGEGLLVLWLPVLLLLLTLVGPFIIIKVRKEGIPVFEFDDWNMKVSNDGKSITVSWGDVTHYTVLKDFILITLGRSDMVVYALPKKEFKNKEEEKEFVDFLVGLGLKKR